MKGPAIFRNPFFWWFIIGIVTLTAIRPFLRRVPEPPPVIGHVPSFSLVADDGRAFGSQELRDQVYVVSFFFTRCRTICPAIMHGMKRLQQGLNERGVARIRLVSITVDPDYDTPEVLRAYAKDLGVDPARWTLLSGSSDAIREVVVNGFKTPMEAAPAPAAGLIDIAHTGKIVLVDGAGGIRGYYGTDDSGLDEVYNRAQHVAARKP